RFGIPNRVWKPDAYGLLFGNERSRAKESVTETNRFRLYGEADTNSGLPASVIFENVRFTGSDNEANLIGAPNRHAFQNVFANGARTMHQALGRSSHRQKFFRKGQRLNARTCSRRWNDAPHIRVPLRNTRVMRCAPARFPEEPPVVPLECPPYAPLKHAAAQPRRCRPAIPDLAARPARHLPHRSLSVFPGREQRIDPVQPIRR